MVCISATIMIYLLKYANYHSWYDLFILHYQETHDNKVHGAKMGATWVLSAPGGPHVGLMNLDIMDILHQETAQC